MLKIRLIEGKRSARKNSFGSDIYLIEVTTVHPEKGEVRFGFLSAMCAHFPEGRWEIIVARQHKFLRTVYLFVHEVGHFLLDLFPIITHKQYDKFDFDVQVKLLWFKNKWKPPNKYGIPIL